jgi:hypothetical protein
MATHKDFSKQNPRLHDNKLKVTGSTVAELMYQLAKLPKDMIVMLEETDGNAIGLGFERVAATIDEDGKKYEVALFHRVNQEWLDKMKTQPWTPARLERMAAVGK